MTGLDTNIILRYVVQDDPVQFALVSRLIDGFTVDEPGFISMVVMTEIVWVLQSNYRSERREIERVIEALLRSRELRIERADLVWQALRMYTRSNADFSDCLVQSCGHSAGCSETVTFDRNAAKTAGMKLLT